MATLTKGRPQLIVEFITLYNRTQEYLINITPDHIVGPINKDLLTTAPNVTALQLEEANNRLIPLNVSIAELEEYQIYRDLEGLLIPFFEQIEATDRPELKELYAVYLCIYPTINHAESNPNKQDDYDNNTYLEYISLTTNREQTSTPNISKEDDRPKGAGRNTEESIIIQLAGRATNAEGIRRLKEFLLLITLAQQAGLITISKDAILWNIGRNKDDYKQAHVKYFVTKVSEVLNLMKIIQNGQVVKAVPWRAWKRFISGIENLAGADDPKETHKQKIEDKIFTPFERIKNTPHGIDNIN